MKKCATCSRQIRDRFYLCFPCHRRELLRSRTSNPYTPPTPREQDLPPPSPIANPYHLAAQKRRYASAFRPDYRNENGRRMSGEK